MPNDSQNNIKDQIEKIKALEAIDFYSPDGQGPDQYFSGHKPRFEFFAQRFSFAQLKGKRILDVGCGLGFLFNYMDTTANYCVGIDNTLLATAPSWKYIQADLNLPFAEKVGEKFDIIFCLETLEHLPNLYSCLYEIKLLCTPETTVIISIPSVSVTHNTIYPDQLFPAENFKKFLHQMCFDIVLHEQHTAAFSQEVFVVTSRSWDNATYRMRFPKPDLNQRHVPPHIAINL